MSHYVELSDLTKIYPTARGPAVIVKDFNLRIEKGEFVSLIGHSGCGKSTVLSMLAGLNGITGGGIVLAGKELQGAGPDRGVVFQSPALLPWLTAFENVLLGVDQVFFTAGNAERREIAEYYLTVVGLADAMHRKPAELSQGMRQRVGIARAFALKPKMLLLDEPFGMLDSLTRFELQQVLIDLWRKTQITALMVTHDVDEALFLSDRIVCMTDGPAAEVGEIVPVHFPRPRDRQTVLEHADYYPLRERLIEFLEVRAHRRRPTPSPGPAEKIHPAGPKPPRPTPVGLSPEKTESMKSLPTTLAASALALAGFTEVHAQYAPPPPPTPFPGFINDALRRADPYNSVWDIGGSVRLRYEMKANALGLPPANDFRLHTTATTRNDNGFFSDKILARVAYNAKWWSVQVEGRSSSTLRDDRSPTGAGPVPSADRGDSGPETDGPLDLHQAYLTLGNHKEFPLSLKVGRQELSYADERLVGAFAWNNLGRVFDAAKVRWQNAWFAADAFTSKLVLPDDNNFNAWNDYSAFSGLYVTTRKIPRNATDLFFFARNDGIGSATANPGAVLPFQTPAPAARDIYTLGARFKSIPGELGRFDYTVEGAYQFGSWKPTLTSARLDHEACAAVVNVGYSLSDTSRLAFEYAFGSGDGDPTDGRHETFDNLYPTNHKFYGYMDFFAWQNIHDLRGIFTLKPTPRLSLALEGHCFWLADTRDNLYNAGGVARGGATAYQPAAAQGTGFGRNPGYDGFVGSELDVIAGYALNKFTSLETGYGHFFIGNYLQQTWSNPALGAQDADWFYLQMVLRF